jgi:uncharacterized protein
VSGDGFRYAMLMVDGREVGGIGQYVPGTPSGTPAAWSVYFAVDNTDVAVAAAAKKAFFQGIAEQVFGL